MSCCGADKCFLSAVTVEAFSVFSSCRYEFLLAVGFIFAALDRAHTLSNLKQLILLFRILSHSGAFLLLRFDGRLLPFLPR